MEKKISRYRLEEARCEGLRKKEYNNAYCSCMKSCDECNKRVAFWCDVISIATDIQERIILKICPEEKNG